MTLRSLNIAPHGGVWRVAAALATAAVVAGCASVPASSPGDGATTGTTVVSSVDPWENWNRKVYSFNDALDEAVVKPVATAYRTAVPELMRTGVSNFFGNIKDVWSAANLVLQGKVAPGLEMGFRVMTNTLMGLGGVLDPATEFGMQKRSEDFGQTLAVWGVGNGPYMMLPLLGPSTVRDSFALVADRQFSASELPITNAGGYALTTLEVVSIRAGLLDATRLMDQVALDRYSFLRDAYLQRRRNDIYDGAPPFVDEFADDPPPTTEPAAKPAVKKPTSAKPAQPLLTTPALPAPLK